MFSAVFILFYLLLLFFIYYFLDIFGIKVSGELTKFFVWLAFMHKSTASIYQRPIELIGGTFINAGLQIVWLANVDSQSRSTRFVAACIYECRALVIKADLHHLE